MKQEEFDRLVGHLEAFAASHPRLYKVKVGLLALLGYAYIFGILAVVAALLAVLAVVAAKGRAHYTTIKAAIPRVKGQAYVTGLNTLVLDPADPLQEGLNVLAGA